MDPYKSLKKKLRVKNAQKNTKVPLMSSERRDGMMLYPVSHTSTGTLYISDTETDGASLFTYHNPPLIQVRYLPHMHLWRSLLKLPYTQEP